jgi:ubiquitin
MQGSCCILQDGGAPGAAARQQQPTPTQAAFAASATERLHSSQPDALAIIAAGGPV